MGFMFVLEYNLSLESFYIPILPWFFYFRESEKWGWFHILFLACLAKKRRCEPLFIRDSFILASIKKIRDAW
ncbi:MAG: hypothetical protein CME60_10910 [Halobacteriovoraceae bacterium]|nr:hypothetical protein [Halobacteriovoraceae bacterium]